MSASANHSAEAFRLDEHVAVVTGAGSGIGQAIAVEFVRAGATVYLLDRDLDAATRVAASLGPRTRAVHCDVTDADSVHSAFADVLTAGPVDILVNNAGVAHIGTVASTTLEDFERLFRVNVQGVFLCTKAVIESMVHQQRGVVINIASVAATAGLADRFAYSMSKGAVVSMTYSVARDYVKHGIRCNSISPGRVHTPFVDNFLAKHYAGNEAEVFARLAASQPIGRMGQPEEVASFARFLASDEAAFLTGTDYPMDGGFLKLNG